MTTPIIPGALDITLAAIPPGKPPTPVKKEPKYIEAHIRFEPQVYEKLRLICFEKRVSMSSLVRESLDKFLSK
jgi:hypothetical protein